jgi:FHA domain
MGAIREATTGRIRALEADHLIGRSYRCSLRLEESSVSGEHASLRWTGGTWVIKDLGSRYGTFLNAQPLQPGIPVTVQPEARLAFGREKGTWVVTDSGPPEVMIVPADGGAALLRRDGVIAIPSVDKPAAIVFQRKDGTWVLERDGRVEPVNAQSPFFLAGDAWRLCNTSPLEETSMSGDGREAMALEEIRLQFRISRNEEHVNLAASWCDRVVELGARSHHYVLLTLARLRLEETRCGEPTAGAGWIDQEALLKLLRLGPERLNLDIFRARRQFGAAGFTPGAGIVERRSATKEMRIGVGDITIEIT